MTTINFDTYVNIIKRPEKIVYKTKVNSAAANIAYVGVGVLSSDENISIEDRSGFIHSNRIFENEVIDYSNIISLEVKTTNFFISDVYSVPASTGSLVKTPLFFKHNLKNFSSSDVIKNVKILDSSLNEVTVTDTYLDEANGVFYSNLESSYSNTLEYTFYYIRYTIANSNQTSSSYTELLDNQAVYQEASIEDFDITAPISSFLLSATDKVYFLEETATAFNITFATARSFSYRNSQNRRLSAEHPTSKDHTDPWHIRVNNGKVFYGSTLYGISDEQFFAQIFNPAIGIKKSEKESSTFINKRIIKTDYENVHEDSSLELYLDVRVKDKDSVTRQNFTTNPNHSDSTYELWSLSDRVGIKSVDHSTGFVEIEGLDLASTDKIECDYYYNENYYDFTEVDFNPIRNEEILKRRTVIYIDSNPQQTNSTLRSQQFNLDGTAIDSNNPNYTTWSAGTLQGYSGTTGPLFVLAEVTIGESQGINKSIIFDTRVHGGSVKKSKIEEVEAKHPEFDSVWGRTAWDGKPFPGNLSYYLQVPLENVAFDYATNAGSIVSHDGFTPREIKSIASEHTAAGVYPIIRAYGVETEITSFELVKNGSLVNVKVKWLGVDNYRYTVYHKENTSTAWLPLTGASISTAGTTNKVVEKNQTISGLSPDKYYHFVVVGGVDIDSEFAGLVTQHINDQDKKGKSITDNPDALKALEVNTLYLG